MNGTINVLVKDKETHQESIITYKSFRDTSYRFNLIGQIDDKGNLMESDPNLSPQHQRKVVEKKAADVADVGVNALDMSIENIKMAIQHAPNNQNYEFHVEQSDIVSAGSDIHSNHIVNPTETIKERKKPGPKPKNKEQ